MNGIARFRNRDKIVFITVSFLFSFLISYIVANREISVGIDTLNYLQNFDKISRCDCLDFSYFEPGFQFITYISSLIFDDSYYYFWLLSFAFNMLLFCFYYKVTFLNGGSKRNSLFLLSLFIIFLMSSNFYLTANVNAIRQGLAAPFVFFAALYFIRHNYLYFLLFSVVSLCFHYSSLIFLIFIILMSWPKRPVLLFFALSFSYAFGFSEFVVKFFSQISGLPIYDLIKNYSDSGLYEGFNVIFFAYTCIPFILAIFDKLYYGKFFLSNKISELFQIYTGLAACYFVLGFAGYANRYAFDSWLFLTVYLAFYFSHKVQKNVYSVVLLMLLSIALIIRLVLFMKVI